MKNLARWWDAPVVYMGSPPTGNRGRVTGMQPDWIPAVGSIVDKRYRLDDLLGHGPTGAVFMTTDMGLGEHIALKVLKRDLLVGPHRESNRFRVHRTLAYRHTRIARVTDANIGGALPFLTSDWVADGETIDSLVSGGRSLEGWEVLDLLGQIAGALESIHRTGTHGNLKPSNVLVVGRSVTITDGYRLVGAHEDEASRPYLAPEVRTMGALEGPAGDVFSMGMLLGLLLVGSRPAPGVGLCAQAFGLPTAIDAVFRRATAAHPGQRYLSVRTFQSALRAVLPEAPLSVTRSSSGLSREGSADWSAFSDESQSQVSGVELDASGPSVAPRLVSLESPATETPATETPGTETLVAETRVAETLVAETLVSLESFATETPVAETPETLLHDEWFEVEPEPAADLPRPAMNVSKNTDDTGEPSAPPLDGSTARAGRRNAAKAVSQSELSPAANKSDAAAQARLSLDQEGAFLEAARDPDILGSVGDSVNISARILLLDDHADERALTEFMLQSKLPNATITVVESAMHFAEELTAGTFDAVVVEAQLAWTTGAAVLETVKRMYDVCVVWFTGAGQEHEAGAALRSGLDAYVVKRPAGYLELAEAVASGIRRHSLSENGASADAAALLEHSGLAMFQCSLEGGLLDANRSFLDMLAIDSVQQAMAVNIHELLFPLEDREHLLSQLMTSGFLKRDELTLAQPAGAPLPVQLTAVVGRDEAGRGRIAGMLQTRAPEADIEAMTLGANVREEALGQVLAERAMVTAHDLKGPLRTLERYSEVMRDRYGPRLDADAEDYLDFIYDAARRMRTQVEQLFTTGEPPPLPAEPGRQQTDCNAVLKTVLASLEADIHANGAVVTSDPLPVLAVEPDEVLHLLQNLVQNGLKFRGEAPPRVHVAAKPMDGFWQLSVTDQGVGVPVAEQDRIFEMFQRGTRIGGTAGAGVGLGVCKAIVERHGGRIWVESGEETTFYAQLPMVPAATDSVTPPISEPPSSPKRASGS